MPMRWMAMKEHPVAIGHRREVEAGRNEIETETTTTSAIAGVRAGGTGSSAAGARVKGPTRMTGSALTAGT